MDFQADLHCHSTVSDGTVTPSDLLYLAKENGLSALSITDHDTVKAYSKELFELAKELKIELLTGIEISASLNDETVHVLGYGFDCQSKVLDSFLKQVQEKRYLRNKMILEKLEAAGKPIREEELYNSKEPSASIGRPHIAKLMVEKGYVKDFKTAFNEYLKDGGLCYVAGEKYSPDEVIDVLHKAKAKAVLAHPQQISQLDVLHKVLDMPFDGIEVYYGKMMWQKERRWLRIANKKGLLVTGGSDFHGYIKPFLSLGCSWVGKEHFDLLKQSL